MDDHIQSVRYCVQCGAVIPQGSDFCYACGAMAPKMPEIKADYVQTDSGAQQSTQQQNGAPQFGPNPYMMTPTPENVASSISNLVRIWGLVAVVFGVIDLVASFFLGDIQIFYGTTINSSEVYLECGCLLISGATALVSSALLKQLKMFWPCFISCLVSAFTSYFGMGGFIGIMTTLIGFYMSFAITRCKGAFKS